MEIVSTSETSVSFYQTTRRNIPEDGHFHTRHRKNMKSHNDMFVRGDTPETFLTRVLLVIEFRVDTLGKHNIRISCLPERFIF
jgi:hypothetical protein